ncbi:hypothetical protein [Streptomyces poriticola]|uniref:hypothetical protein n=1 Tax=Streptomyces poriticola TaxID=3120506 RepID=UPI002FCE5EB3
MKKNLGRSASVAAAASVLALGATLASAGTASAHPSVKFDYSSNQIMVLTGGTPAGYANWFADPQAGWPGDLITAYDSKSDGYGIEAHLSNGRVASTRGHNAPYTDKASGNLPEGKSYKMWVCLVKGSWSSCSSKITVTA